MISVKLGHRMISPLRLSRLVLRSVEYIESVHIKSPPSTLWFEAEAFDQDTLKLFQAADHLSGCIQVCVMMTQQAIQLFQGLDVRYLRQSRRLEKIDRSKRL